MALLRVHKDTLVGTLDYSDFRVATGTMGFKHQRLDAAAVATSLAAGALDLHAHALAPVAALPVLEVISAVHILADLTLPLGTVVHDDLA